MSRDYDEKRDFIRVSVDCEIKFREMGTEKMDSGRVINLSGRGMLFVAEYGTPVDSHLEVLVTPEREITPPLHAKVRVVRMEKNRRGEGYQIGAIIVEMLDD